MPDSSLLSNTFSLSPHEDNRNKSGPNAPTSIHSSVSYQNSPDGGFLGWLVVFASFCIYVTVVGFQYVVGLLYNAWLDDFDSFPNLVDRRATLGWACSVQAGTFLGGSMISGLIIKRYSERVCLWISAVFALLGALGASHFTPSSGDGQVNAFILIFFFGFVLGCCCSFASLTAIVGVQAYFVKRRGIATGLVVAGSGFGALIQGPLIQMAILKYKWRGALDIFGIVTATVLILASFAFIPIKVQPLIASNSNISEVMNVPIQQVQQDEIQTDVVRQSSFVRALAHPAIVDADVDAAEMLGKNSLGGLASHDLTKIPDWEEAMVSIKATEKDSSSSTTTTTTNTTNTMSSDFPSMTLRTLLNVPSFRAYTLFICFYAFVWFSIPGHFARSAVEAGATVEEAALLVSTQGIGNTIGRIVLGLSVDLFPKHKTNIISIAVLSLSIGMLLLSIPQAASSVPYLFFFMAICGSLGGSIVSLQPALIIEMVGMKNLPIAQGAFNTFQAPFALMSAPTLGALRSSFGGYTPYPWLFVALICFTAFALSLRISKALK